MPYAAPSDLEDWFGQERLRQLFSHLDHSRLENVYSLRLQAASGMMDQAFSGASYLVPIDTSLVEDTEKRSALVAQLKTVCCSLAIGLTIGGLIDLPESGKEAYRRASDWLKSIRNETDSLVGIPKAGDQATLVSAGRIGLVTNPEDSAALPAGFFEAWRFTPWQA